MVPKSYLKHDRFEVIRLLGQGGMGVVYEAWDHVSRGLVALKLLRAVEPRGLVKFKQEFRSLADLQHVNLVRLGELFATDTEWFFTMELVHGRDFMHHVTGRAPKGHGQFGEDITAPAPAVGAEAMRPVIDEDKLWESLQQLARGLDVLHAAGKVHRDVKPSNVLVTEEGRVVLLDFGLVTETGRERGDSEHNVVGTLQYMAPEQAAALRVGPAADWYAVGTMVYEVLTGHAPFLGSPLAVMMEKQRREPVPPRTLFPSIPAHLSELCVDLLRTDPAARLSGRRALERLGVAPASATSLAMGSMTRHASFIGRRRELASMEKAWSASHATATAGATCVIVRGESGIGKSALARQFLDERGDDATPPLTFSARCYEREAVPFKAFDGIVDGLSRHVAALPDSQANAILPADAGLVARLFPVLRRIPALASAPSVKVQSPHELRLRAFAALRELLVRIAEKQPTILYIDDFQWADADSLALLEQVMGGPGAPRLCLLVTMRPVEGGAREALLRLASATHHVELGGLEASEAHELAAELLATAPSDAIDTIVGESAGHPLFLQELVRHVASGARVHAARLDDALRERVDMLEPGARRLIEVLAVAGEPLAAGLAVEAATLEHGEGMRFLGVLRAGHLVRSSGRTDASGLAGDRVECYHDRVREAVTARLGADVTRRHHAALAGALEASGAAGWAPLALVRHLEAAGDPERAASQASRAARGAAENLAFDRAAELYNLALRLGTHAPDEKRKLLISLAESLGHAGHVVESADIYLEAADGADDATRLTCLARAAEYLIGTGHFDEGERALSYVLAELGERLAPTPRRALVSMLWHRARMRMRGSKLELQDASQIRPRDLLRIDAYRAMATGLGLIDTVRGVDFTARSTFYAAQAGDRERLVRSLVSDATAHAAGGRSGRKRADELAAMARRAAENGSPTLHIWTVASSGILSYLGGRLPAAIEELPRAEAMLRDETTGTTWELATVRLFLALSLRYAGRLNELRALGHQHIAEAARRGDRYSEATLRRVVSLVYLGDGDPARAEAELARCAWEPPPGRYHLQNWYEWRARAEVMLYRGTVDALVPDVEATFASLRSSLLWRVQYARMEACWLAGRMALVRAAGGASGTKDVRAQVAFARQMVRKLGREDHPFGPVWSRLLAAGVALAGEDQDGAVRVLREARELARGCGLVLPGAAAGWVAAEVIGGDEGRSLAAEASAELAGQGVRDAERFVGMLVPGRGSR